MEGIRHYNVGLINILKDKEIRLYSPTDTWIYVSSTHSFAANFSTRNNIPQGVSVYCLCNAEYCLYGLGGRSPFLEFEVGNWARFDLQLGEPILSNGKDNSEGITNVYNIIPRKRNPLFLRDLALPRIPSYDFFFNRNVVMGQKLGFIATKRVLFADIEGGHFPFCVCYNMKW